jgi:phage shock protein A
MWDAVRRWWRYWGAKLGVRLDEKADPKVQLEQAIKEGRQQHRRLIEQATNVIANQKQTQLRLDRAIEDYEKANASARQALLLADQEARAGNADKATTFNQAAEGFASRIVSLEAQVDQLRDQLLDATRASEQAKAAVTQNSAMLQKRLAEREQLLSQLDQARMQEQLNKAMSQLSEAVGEDVPTFE